MWFGTRDGLNRFDGYRFKVYRFPENNLIHSMHIDEFGTLLVGTEKAIYKYNAKSDSFLLLVISANYPIDEIISDREGNIWFNANNVLSKYIRKKIKN
jgi:ligand-binding sensor domain-containing protein